jgi:MFS transporter, ACS family, pantothenate transporter
VECQVGGEYEPTVRKTELTAHRRWLFVIDGIITIPVALSGFLLFPGIPDSPKAFFLTESEISLAKKRLEKAKVTRAGKLDLDVFKRSLARWHIWLFVFCYM